MREGHLAVIKEKQSWMFFKDGKTDFIQATAAVERLHCKLRYLY